MPKMKTHKGIKKRFKVTATGKVLHKRCGSSHLNSHKSGKQIRRLRKKSVVKIGAEARRLRHALRYRESARPHEDQGEPVSETPATEPTTTPPVE
jgi:large subunit ribosomal protein L35